MHASRETQRTHDNFRCSLRDACISPAISFFAEIRDSLQSSLVLRDSFDSCLINNRQNPIQLSCDPELVFSILFSYSGTTPWLVFLTDQVAWRWKSSEHFQRIAGSWNVSPISRVVEGWKPCACVVVSLLTLEMERGRWKNMKRRREFLKSVGEWFCCSQTRLPHF